MVNNSPLIRPYFLWGVALGGTLDSHEIFRGVPCNPCSARDFPVVSEKIFVESRVGSGSQRVGSFAAEGFGTGGNLM